MPNWKFHNEWAVKMGIPIQISNWVNKREDLPKFDQSNNKSLQAFKDSMPDSQPDYTEMANKGTDYLKAWMLHVLIDELEDICESIVEDGLKEYGIGIDLYEVASDLFNYNNLLRLMPSDITKFISDNMKELLVNMPIPYFQINRNSLFNSEN